jgi:hypothetical protein
MTKGYKPSLIVLIVVVIASIASCNKTCDEGYDGKRCDVEIRDRYVGTWNAVEQPNNKTYSTTISKGSGILDMVISSSFSDSLFFRPVKATVSSDAIHIPLHKPDTSQIWVEGTGLIEDGYQRINWTYILISKYDTPEVIASYTGVWTKK